MSVPTLITADELIHMESSKQFALIAGELIEVSPSTHFSSENSITLVQILGRFVQKHRLGRLSGESGGFMRLRNPDRVVAPDIGFIRLERAPRRLPRGEFAPFPPDLAIEIMSESNSFPELARKAALYIDAGTPLVWVVDPVREFVAVFRPGAEPIRLVGEDQLSGVEVLPGFAMPVAEIFKDPPEA